MSGSATTLAELLIELTNTAPTLPLYRFLNDGELESDLLTTAELHKSAMAIARRLREHCNTGDRVLLLAAPGLDFIRGFFGIQYAGLIATASYPPHPRRVDRTLNRMQGIVALCQPKVALATRALHGFAEQLGLPAIDIDAAELSEGDYRLPVQVDRDTPAFLQFTSGSTREPRGVILTHRNVLENLRFIKERFGHTRDSVGVIWLPPYHDMGLVGGILEPLYAGFPVVLLNPLHVLQRPMRWLNAITRYRATTSGGPNFAFDHCTNIVSEEQKSQLDLSSWQVAFCGAEPIRPATWRRFSDAFAKCGFKKKAFFPCYGLAEATLMVTGGQHLTSPQTSVVESKSPNGKLISTEYISCGSSDRNHLLRIVDRDSAETLADGNVGEIWVAGESVSPGYWNDENLTQATFTHSTMAGERWLHTGDLGFIQNGSLFVTGRCKDLIIIAGRNLYPQDLEAAIEECHPRLQPNGTCVFSVQGEMQERLIVVAEMRPGIRRLASEENSEIATAIRRTLSTEFDVHFKELQLVKAGSLPRTSSGKKRRHETLSLFELRHFRLEDIALGDAGVTTQSRGIHQASPSARRFQQRLALVMVVVPILGLVAAIVLAWGEGIHSVDLAWLIGLYMATVIGVEVGFHRHFSHRAFQAAPWVRSMLCILGSMAAQGPLVFWVATHRRHHAFSDQAEDPHSPVPTRGGVAAKLQGLFHSHLGWLFRSELTNPMQYGPDILRDPLTFKLNQYYPLWVVLGLALPALGCLAVTGTWVGLARGFLWGGLVRVLFVHHATWSVNSICHAYGKREFETRDDSRNNAWLVVSSLGGSWHNNHHAFPNSAYTGIRRWQMDPSGWIIRLLALAGLVWDVKTPSMHSSSQAESSPLNQVSIKTPKHIVHLASAAKRMQQIVAMMVVAPPLLGTILAIALAITNGLGAVELVTFASMYVLCMLGITIGFHRYFAHKSFETSRSFALVLAAIGSMAAQGPLLFWVSTHRSHHAYSDRVGDPHSPNLHGRGVAGLFRGWWHAHIGWMFSGKIADWSHFTRDLMRDRGLFRISQRYFYWVLLGLLIPTLIGGWIGQSWYSAFLGFLWGGLVRICLVNQASWCVGSICHMFGSRPFATDDHSANNHLVAVLAFGEGLQNNHHAFPSSYAHRVRWWEPDLSATVLLVLRTMGLVWDLKFPSPRVIQESRVQKTIV